MKTQPVGSLRSSERRDTSAPYETVTYLWSDAPRPFLFRLIPDTSEEESGIIEDPDGVH